MSRVDPPDYPAWPTARRLLRLWWEQRRLGIRGLVCAFAYTGVSLTIPLLIQRAIDNAVVHHEHALWPYLAAIVLLAALRMAINFTRRYATARIGIRIEARMRELLYQAYLVFPRAFYDRHATGQVLSRATNDLYPIRYFVGWGLVQGVQSVLMIIGAGDPARGEPAARPLHGGVDAARRHRRLALRPQGDADLARGPASEGRRHRGSRRGRRRHRDGAGVRARRRRPQPFRRAGQRGPRRRSCARPESRRRHLPGLFYLPSLSLAVVLFFGGREVIAGNLTYGEFALFITLLLQLVWPLESMGWIINLAQRALASAGRSFAWLEGIETLPEPSEPKTLPPGRIGVRFEAVRFAYGGEGETLRGIDLEVEPGEVVAICGGTGSGKTTLLNLLPRFYDPTAGRVLVGGVDARDLSLADLRKTVAVVTQRPVLFSVPLRENLLGGRPDATGTMSSRRRRRRASLRSSTTFRTDTTR